jgi:hypothetical protein
MQTFPFPFPFAHARETAGTACTRPDKTSPDSSTRRKITRHPAACEGARCSHRHNLSTLLLLVVSLPSLTLSCPRSFGPSVRPCCVFSAAASSVARSGLRRAERAHSQHSKSRQTDQTAAAPLHPAQAQGHRATGTHLSAPPGQLAAQGPQTRRRQPGLPHALGSAPDALALALARLLVLLLSLSLALPGFIAASHRALSAGKKTLRPGRSVSVQRAISISATHCFGSR